MRAANCHKVVKLGAIITFVICTHVWHNFRFTALITNGTCQLMLFSYFFFFFIIIIIIIISSFFFFFYIVLLLLLFFSSLFSTLQSSSSNFSPWKSSQILFNTYFWQNESTNKNKRKYRANYAMPPCGWGYSAQLYYLSICFFLMCVCVFFKFKIKAGC